LAISHSTRCARMTLEPIHTFNPHGRRARTIEARQPDCFRHWSYSHTRRSPCRRSSSRPRFFVLGREWGLRGAPLVLGLSKLKEEDPSVSLGSSAAFVLSPRCFAVHTDSLRLHQRFWGRKKRASHRRLAAAEGRRQPHFDLVPLIPLDSSPVHHAQIPAGIDCYTKCRYPNQRASRIFAERCFSSASATEGSTNVPWGDGPDRKSMSLRPTRPEPNSM
jgi:hypothetical protein